MKHKIEIFSAECTCCDRAIEMVKNIADDNDEVIILNMSEPAVTERAIDLGIQSVPTILINGEIADCCSHRGPEKKVIQAILAN